MEDKGGSQCQEFVTLALMEKYGWTYEEYLSQPRWILEYALAKAEIESQSNHK